MCSTQCYKPKVQIVTIMYTSHYVAVVRGQVTKGPENVAVLVGSDVTLRCAGTDLGWESFASDTTTDPLTISYKADLAMPDKYDLITEPPGTYDLTIKFIKLEQGGRYKCKALRVGARSSTISVQVITFSGETLLLFLH